MCSCRVDVLVAPVADPAALARCVQGLIEDQSLRVSMPLSAEAAARAYLASVGNMPERVAQDLRTLL